MLDEAKFDAIFEKLEKGLSELDTETLAALHDPKRMLNNALTVKNLDDTGHLLGLNIDFSGKTVRLNIPPHGSQQVQNFSFLTMWFLRIHMDPPVQLTNGLNNICYYEVTLLKTNGVNQPQQFINPHAGASVRYDMDVGDRLIVVPKSMGSYMLRHAEGVRFAAPENDPLIRDSKE